jgi:hypothetical protein
LDGSNGQEPYQTYAIYIAKTEYWDINKETIPIGGDQLVDWELKGQGIQELCPSLLTTLEMANRFADLLKAFIKLRRWWPCIALRRWLMW